uniref:Uncharacterized protein n=1 Tax=Biomphalaria glabrata TaxID=6526 RepID=A0A2C9L0E3_BIOGL
MEPTHPETGPVLPNVPGDFYIFWNILVPLSLLANIYHFGVRTHELGLILLLWLNPFLLRLIVQSPILSWLNTIFIIIWLERIMKRWAWFKIYTCTFLRNLMLLLLFLVIPGLLMNYIWLPIYNALPTWLERYFHCHNKTMLRLYSSIILLLISVGMLLHAIYFYTHSCGCIPLPSCPKMPCCLSNKKKRKCISSSDSSSSCHIDRKKC